MTPQPATFDERFIETFENVVEMRSDITALKTDVSELKTNVSTLSIEMAKFKGEVKSEIAELRGDIKSEIAELRGEMGKFRVAVEKDMAGMEARLQTHVNRQIWKMISVIVPLVVVSVGLTGHFVKILG